MSNNMIFGVFETRAAADKAIADLRAAGYSDKQISMVARNSEGKVTQKHPDGTDAAETNAGEGLAIGAAAGGVTAAAVGAGIMAGVIPVIGPVLALGPLAVTLINAATGAAVAGIAGALIGMGIPKEDADFYESEVAAGRYLVTVEKNNPANDAGAIYTRHGGYNRLTSANRAKTVSRV